MGAELLRFLLSKGGRRLVEDQQCRPPVECLGDLDELPIARTQATDGQVDPNRSTKLLEQALSLGDLRRVVNPEAVALARRRETRSRRR